MIEYRFDCSKCQRIKYAIRRIATVHDYYVEFHIDGFGTVTVEYGYVHIGNATDRLTYHTNGTELASAEVESYWSMTGGDTILIRIGEGCFEARASRVNYILGVRCSDPREGRWEDEVETIYDREVDE